MRIEVQNNVINKEVLENLDIIPTSIDQFNFS